MPGISSEQIHAVQGTHRTRIIVVGGGFGGAYAARRLALRLRHDAEIILIDRQTSMLYTPMLAEAAGRSISLNYAAVPYAELLRGVHHVQAEVASLDLATRSVSLSTGEVLQADHLVLALGSVTNYRNVPGAREYSLSMKSLEDACLVQQRVADNVRKAAALPPGEERSRLLRGVVAGGGYTGVETVAAVNDLMRDEAAAHGIDPKEVQLTIMEAGERLMGELPASLAAYGQKLLQEDGITVRTGASVQQANDAQTATLNDGTQLTQALLIWNTGIRPNPLIENTTGPKGSKHGLLTDSSFRVQGLPGVWALGDCAETPEGRDPKTFFAPTAQNAVREGTHVADNIVQVMRGRRARPFHYRQIGSLAVISRNRGVAHVFGVNVRGVAAWLLWRAVYIEKVPSTRNRLGILADYVRLLWGRRYIPAASDCSSFR